MITVSTDCLVRVIAQSDLAQLGQRRVDGCSASEIALAADGRMLLIPTRHGTLNLLSIPDLSVRSWGAIGSSVSAVLVPAGDRYLFTVDAVAHQLQVFDLNTQSILRTVSFRDRLGRALTYVRMEETKARRSVVITFQETELWEIFLAPDAAPVFEGLVHDYRMGEAVAEAPSLPLRRIALERPIDQSYLELGGAHLILLQHDLDGTLSLQSLNLDVRRVVAKTRFATPASTLALMARQDGSMRVLLSDGLGVQVFRLPLLGFERRVQLAGAGCRIATAPKADWIALYVCRGTDARRVIIVDAETFETRATLGPFAGNTVSGIVVNNTATRMWVVSFGSGGKLVGFAVGSWTRENEIAVPHLSGAWGYR